MSTDNFNPVSIIRKKRDGHTLSEREIKYLIGEYTKDQLPDYQMSAFLMAGYLQGFNEEEAAVLTEAMLYSGKVLELDEIPGKKVDKHSTGGVGDKLSLVLAPIVASYGISVPMISGRGLGHTGGTLDKLESIAGFEVDIPPERFREILGRRHLVMAGQSEEIAPADKRLYALRDVTATVESIPLIASSIMSKKLAEDIDGLVLDVKFGSGAFMNEPAEALKLAETLVGIGEHFGTETVAYLTNMEQPLGYKIGNWLEVEESMEALQGEGPDDVMEIVHVLAGTMIWLGGEAASIEAGIAKSERAVRNGQAFDTWLDVVEEQGGDRSVLTGDTAPPEAEFRFDIEAERGGSILSMDAYQIGMASLELGAGRKRKEDPVDPAAGVILQKKCGDSVDPGETIAVGYTNNNRAIEIGRELLSRAVRIGAPDGAGPSPQGLITYKVDKKGIEELKT